MGNRLHRVVAVLAVAGVVAGLVLVFVGAGSASPPGAAGERGRGAVVAYWTPARVARAVPREVSPDRAPSFRPSELGKPGGGSGGGGSATTGTGTAWAGGGKVKLTTGKVLFTMA